jgi:hypothetical protein
VTQPQSISHTTQQQHDGQQQRHHAHHHHDYARDNDHRDANVSINDAIRTINVNSISSISLANNVNTTSSVLIEA